MNTPRIIHGDPDQTPGGATCTSFVLPFRFRPTRTSATNGPVYRVPNQAGPEEVRKRRYFTSETAKVLYQHARWFELPDDDWAEAKYPARFLFHSDGLEFDVQLKPPRLALFEFHELEESLVQDLFHTGFLIIEAYFPRTEGQPAPTYADILRFNERFRYWRMPFPEHAEARMKDTLGNPFGDELADLYLGRWAKLLDIPLRYPGGELFRLFPHHWMEEAENWWRREVQPQPRDTAANDDDSGWICYTDDRAFVWSCMIIDEGGQPLEPSWEPSDETFTQSAAWVRLLNVDDPGDLARNGEATEFEKAWARDRCYARWRHFGTLYGFNYHAGVMLARPCAEPPITRHFRGIYFDMALLLLFLRISLFRFSRDLSRLSADSRTQKTKHWKKEFEHLRRQFALFTNLYQFPLISNQQQAIEIYAGIRKNLDVKELFEEVDEEIRSSHEFFEIQESSKLNQRADRMTLIGLLVAVLLGWEPLFKLFGWIE